jgi:ABC-type multidrug transport system fused ATPase/permease subunit
VLHDGRVIESGTPAELMRSGKAFIALFGDEALAA